MGFPVSGVENMAQFEAPPACRERQSSERWGITVASTCPEWTWKVTGAYYCIGHYGSRGLSPYVRRRPPGHNNTALICRRPNLAPQVCELLRHCWEVV